MEGTEAAVPVAEVMEVAEGMWAGVMVKKVEAALASAAGVVATEVTVWQRDRVGESWQHAQMAGFLQQEYCSASNGLQLPPRDEALAAIGMQQRKVQR